MEMTAAGRPSNGWASADDWKIRRPMITNLYRDQNKTLKETMQVMEEKHDFYATVRMYKARFAQWGIEKKIKAEYAVEIFRQLKARAEAGKSSVAYIGGRKINPDRLQRYRYRAAAIVSEQILKVEQELGSSPSESSSVSSHVVCRTPSPTPEDAPTLSPQLDDPTDFKVPHECMQILRGYIAGSIESGAFRPPPPEAKIQVPDAFTWAHYIATSQGLIAHNRTKEGFFLLGICFEQYKSHLLNPDPFFWLATYKAALVLGHRDAKLGDAFMRYASNLTSVMLPPTHPFNRVWTRIMLTGLQGLQRHAAVLFESYLSSWNEKAGLLPPDEASLVQMAFVFIQLHCSGMLSYSFTSEALDSMMAVVSRSVSGQFLLQEAKFRMACLLLEQGKLNKAETVTKQIIEWIDSLAKLDQKEFDHLRCKCLWTMFDIKDKQGVLVEASQVGLRLVKLCQDLYGPVHLQTLDAISALQKFYTQHNNAPAAQRISDQFDKRWAVFYDKAQANNGFPHGIDQPWLHRCIELDEDERLIQQVIDQLEGSSLLDKP